MSARRRPLTLIPIVFVLLSMLWPLGFRAQASGGQPILLVVNSAAPNPFGPYLGEILRAEGIVDFDLVELANLDSATLNNARLAVLAETPLSSGQASMFSSFVAGGGRLVAMRPDAQLDAALGLSRSAGGVAQGYLAINTAHPTGAGLTGVTLPIFGDAARLAPTSGATVAQLYSGRDSATSYSAVIRSGATATWAFDLARSVAYARQGNPANAGQDRDGLPPIRTTDVFHNAIDLERVGLPHADIQMRLFSRTIGDLLADSAPLPRLWYFPDARRTLLVPTGDDHGQPAQHFASMVSNVESRGGRISFYGPRYAPNPTAADTATWRAAGHEVGLHPYAYADGVNLDQAFTTNENWFATQGRGAASRTTRTHQVEWQGWAGAASVEANHNIGMDLSFYTWGPSITRANGSQVQGYITGSGLPMRFVDEGGALIPVYQQVTVLIDEAMFSAISSYAAGLTTEQALAVSRDIIDRSQAGNYSAIATQFHVDYYPFGEVQPWVHGTLDHAASLGIPIWTAERWLRFTEARAATTISGLTWDPQAGTASFQVTVPAGTDAQSLMLPASFDGRSLSGVSVNGASVGVTNESINGRATSFVSLGAGSHSVVASYAGGQAPTSTPTTPTTPTATATGAPTTTPTSTATPSGPTSTPTSSATSTQAPTPPPSSGAQSWTRQVGSCDPALQGAVLGIAGSGCGGGGTSFDALEIYDPAIVKDVATTAAPCAGVAVGATCYRMWYSGESSSGVYRIGHATSPDGRNWTRVVGPGPGGSVLGAGAPGGFDGVGTAYPHVLKDGGTYKLWYVGFDSSYIGGIGYATSTDGVSWTRQGSPVLAPSGVAGSFDRDAPNTPFVIKDRASAAAPCPGIADGATCYRMWYEGVNNEGAYTFRIGYAVSPDGLSWTRVAGPTPSGAVLDRDGSSYEAASVGVPIVIKDGALFRMWYEAKDYAGNFTLLYASSPDGLVWTRSNPSAPVWTGADDPATFAPDNVWGHEVLRDGSTYRMWYSLSTQPDSQRIGLTESSLGTTLSDISLGVAGNQYTLTFSTNRAIPAGGSLLIALPPGVDVATVSPGATSGFGGAALTVVPAALTDAGSHNVARGALLIQLSGAAAPGPKSVQFSLAAPPAQAGEISIRSFTTHDSLEFGATTLPGDPSGPTATATLPPTATGTAGPTSAPTSTSTPGPTSTPASTSTSTPTLSPTPAAGELVHTSVGDFSAACTVADNSWVGTSGGGAVGLRGAFGDSFDGPALGGQWVSGRWSGASFSPSFVEGAMALDGAGGAFVRSQSSFSARTLEAVVDFGSGPWQHVGWGSLDFEGDRYLLFSTFGSSSNLFVRSNNGGSEQNLDLGPVSSGFQHIRIEWRDLGGGQDEVRYFLGGTLRATHTLPSLPSLHVYSSHNSGAGAPALLVDALHALPPYAASGSFTSCALDAGSNSAWSSISWQATTPAGSSVAVETRASSDGLSWTAWAPASSGATLASPARFLQYRLSLATGDTALSPLVESVTLTRGAAGTPLPTSTPSAAPTLTATPSDTPIATQTATATSAPSATASATSAPTSSNTPTATNTATATSMPTPSADALVHTSVGDFSAACIVADNSWVGTSGGGAVGLRGAFGDSFDGPALGGQWTSGRWSGASFTPSFSDGVMALDGAGGAFVRSQSSFSARTLEAVVDFGSGPWQHVGWGSLDFEGDRYLLFSTFGSSSNLFVRSNNGGFEQNLDLGPVPSGFQHVRIEWRDLGGGQDEVRYFLGGTLRATHTLPSLPSLHVYSSHNSGAGAPALLVDALHALPPYSASGSFSSCALDAGSNSAWSSISWQATTPAGSSVAVETRASSDGLSWTAWAPTTSGASLASPARFLQYRLSLATGDTALSPLVEAVTLTRGAAAAPTQTVTNTPAPTETVTVPTETVTVPTETVTVPTETATVPTATATVPTATATVPTATATVPTATATSQPASTAVGLANGGFELDINADGRPDSWTSDARFTVDTSAGIAYSGGAAGRHQATTNPSYNIDQRAGTGTIVPGKGYTLSGWVNIPATSDSFTFRLQVRWLNSAGTLLSTTTVRSFTAATSGWTQVRSSTLRAPANAATAEVRMNVSSLNATVYVDDLAFELANLLANPGFELDANADNRPDSWTSSARFLRSSTLRSGAAAGNLTATTNPSFTINSSTISGLYAGASHRVSGWVNIPARADDFSLSVQLQWRDSSNVAVGANVPLATHAAVTPGWAGFDQELLVPAGATRAIILLSTTSLNGNIYVDDFRFE